MKKLIGIALAALVVALVGAAIAGSVAERTTQALATATGSASWQNTYEYAALDLKRVSINKSLAATNYVDVTRVWTSGGVTYTNAIGRITVAGNLGTQATLAYNLLQFGDYLVFDSAINTGSTAIIEFEVQKH